MPRFVRLLFILPIMMLAVLDRFALHPGAHEPSTAEAACRSTFRADLGVARSAVIRTFAAPASPRRPA